MFRLNEKNNTSVYMKSEAQMKGRINYSALERDTGFQSTDELRAAMYDHDLLKNYISMT